MYYLLKIFSCMLSQGILITVLICRLIFNPVAQHYIFLVCLSIWLNIAFPLSSFITKILCLGAQFMLYLRSFKSFSKLPVLLLFEDLWIPQRSCRLLSCSFLKHLEISLVTKKMDRKDVWLFPPIPSATDTVQLTEMVKKTRNVLLWDETLDISDDIVLLSVIKVAFSIVQWHQIISTADSAFLYH